MKLLEWVHDAAKDMSIHTGTSYSEAMSALLNASDALADAWDDGCKAVLTQPPHRRTQPLRNPYRRES